MAGEAAGQGTSVPESPHGTELSAYSRLRTYVRMKSPPSFL